MAHQKTINFLHLCDLAIRVELHGGEGGLILDGNQGVLENGFFYDWVFLGFQSGETVGSGRTVFQPEG